VKGKTADRTCSTQCLTVYTHSLLGTLSRNRSIQTEPTDQYILGWSE